MRRKNKGGRKATEPAFLLLSDPEGNVFEAKEYLAVGMSARSFRIPYGDELIDLPYGSNLFMLPGTHAVGYNLERDTYEEVSEYQGIPVKAVAAFMAPAYLQFHLPAFTKTEDATRLPLFGYTAVGWQNNRFVVSGRRIDPDPRQDLKLVDCEETDRRAREKLRKEGSNRLSRHLIENCHFSYGCPAARNFIMDRWECPLPTSPACNSRCLGCISYQAEDSSIESSQNRIAFVPEVSEIVEIAVRHLEQAADPVLSFGQGCEGEPLLLADLIAESIREIRKRSDRGIINVNTNGSRPEEVVKLCEAGLDSIRVSLNSAQEKLYNLYYKPVNYDFKAVKSSINIVGNYGRWTSINYFIFPGLTDTRQEMENLSSLIEESGLDMIQTRNLNIDPYWYLEEVVEKEGKAEEPFGIPSWLDEIREHFPLLLLGYFNPHLETMRKTGFQFRP